MRNNETTTKLDHIRPHKDQLLSTGGLIGCGAYFTSECLRQKFAVRFELVYIITGFVYFHTRISTNLKMEM